MTKSQAAARAQKKPVTACLPRQVLCTNMLGLSRAMNSSRSGVRCSVTMRPSGDTAAASTGGPDSISVTCNAVKQHCYPALKIKKVQLLSAICAALIYPHVAPLLDASEYSNQMRCRIIKHMSTTEVPLFNRTCIPRCAVGQSLSSIPCTAVR